MEEKLKEIINELYDLDYEFSSPEEVDGFIKRIKQAFADEGYVHIDRYSGGGIAVNDGEVLRTGAEWYEWYEKELMSINIFAIADGVEPEMVNAIKQAGKKASRL